MAERTQRGGPCETARDVAVTDAEATLLMNAAWLLHRRASDNARYSDFAATALAQRLEQLAEAGSRISEPARRSALALAHRVLDDDHPEFTEMWTEMSI
jgi:hypothetical protein